MHHKPRNFCSASTWTPFFGLLLASAALMAQTPVFDLPVPPANIGVTGMILNPDGNSYVGVTLSGVPAGLDIVNGTYDGWCIDFFGTLAAANASTYNSYGGVMGNPNPALPLNVLQNGQTAWNEVNWLINNKTGLNNDSPGSTPSEVQDAIWTLLDPYYPAAFNDAVSNTLVTDAENNGANFIPGPGQFAAVLLYIDGIQGQSGTKNIQDLIIQVRVGGTIGDFVWMDQNHNGLQDAGEPGINGVTVDLYKGNTLVATTVTTNAPAGYPYPGPNPAGFYQFTGLAPGSYTVVIPNGQAALSGTAPTLPLQGTNVLIDSNGQEGTIPGTTTPAVTAPVTLPNSNQAPNSLTDNSIDFGFYPTQPITLTCPAGTAQVGTPYSSELVASGGQAPYTFSISAGSLPPGLSLNLNTGAITGIPTTAGAFSFTAQVTDSSGQTAGTTTTNCTINVNPAPITLTCPASTAMVGVFYNSALMASGGKAPYIFSIVSGNLPTGLTLNPNTGAIAGTPTTPGPFSFVAKVVDSSGQTTGTTTTNCTITVNPSTLTLACPATSAQVGVPYSSALSTTGGQAPFIFSIASGSLPSGLSLNPNTGAITGTPTTAGPFSFTAKVVDSSGLAAGTVTTNCTITVKPSPLVVTCEANNTAEVGVPYNSGPMTVTGGVAPYTFAISSGSLPPGLTLNPTNGAITGTPTAPGTFTVQVTDAAGNIGQGCVITVKPGLSVTCQANNTAEVGVPYNSGPMMVTGGTAPYTFSISSGSLPPGLTLNPTNGAITGTPTAPGTFTVQVTDALGNVGQGCVITVKPGLSVTCQANTTAEVGVPYNSGPMAVTGGTAPYTFSISSGSLPPGLTLNPTNGAITGTPTAPGTFTVQVKDALGNVGQGCVITVKPGLSVTCQANTTAEVGVPYNSGPMAVTGGTAPYTYSISSGSLPPGLTLNPTNGAISGTPTAPGTFTVQVTDALGNVGQGCVITVKPGVSVICQANNTATVGVPFNSGPMTVTGGTAPYTFSIGSGALPPGLTLNTTNGAVSGTPTAPGSFTVKVTDALGNVGSACVITVIPAPLTVICEANSTAEVGIPYNSGPMTVSGGVAPYAFSISSGSLPPGLTLNPTNGAITGTPTATGTFTVQVTDAAGHVGQGCVITVNPGPSIVACQTNGTATVGVPYNSGPVTVSGGIPPYKFSIVGTLPAGLTLNTTTGAVSGTPTATGSFSVTATDSAGVTVAGGGASALSLGTDANYIFIDTGSTHLGWNAYQLNGNVLFGQGLTVALSGGNNGGLGAGYKVYDDSTTSISGSLQNPLTFASVPASQTAAAAASAKSVSNYASSLAATQTFATINNTLTINGSGGMNVIDVGSIQNATLTINGSANDYFIFNVSTGIQTNHVMTLTGGVTASHILWNLTGTGTVLQTSGGDVLVGTFLATNGGAFQFSELQLTGALINTGGNIQLVSGNHTLTQAGFTPPPPMGCPITVIP